MTDLFSSRALKRRQRVGERSGPIILLTPPLKATLALGVLIAFGGSLWATLAQIPLTVHGTGVLLPPGTISTSSSLIDGAAYWMFQQPSSRWHQQAWEFQQRPGNFSDQSVTQLARAILSAGIARKFVPTDQPSAARMLLRYRDTRMPAGRLLLWVQASSQTASLSSALNQLDKTLQASTAEQNNIQAQQAALSRLYRNRRDYLTNMQRLADKGVVSRTSILDEQATVNGINSQILSNNNQLIVLNRNRDDAFRTLRNQLATLVQQQLVFAARDLYLDQVVVQNGEIVGRGQELLKLSDQSLNDPSLVPVFLGSNEMAQVRTGMTALATPAGYKRSEVGGIRGRVVFKARLPGTLDTVTSAVGLRTLAQQIVAQESSPTKVILALERAKGDSRANSGGYQWSSRSEIPFPPTPGERLDVEITTRRVRPIQLVLPIFKQAMGLAPPDAPTNSSRGGSAP
jgi:hypothetical protein